jgi:uncharacterized protein
MSTTESRSPRLTNVGTRPVTPRKLFVNIAVADLQRSVDFFEALGFTFNAQFTNETCTAMLVGEDAYFMLLTKERFASFSKRPLGDPSQTTNSLYALAVESRASVDEMVETAVANGGAHALEPQDHGFMYGWSFYDPDGHHWEVFWMDPSVPVS